MKKQKFTIQIEHSAVYSKEIQADSIEEALATANQIVADENILIVKPINGWALEWNNDRKITGIFS